VAWILIAFSLFVIEIRAITKDRRDFANDEASRRKEENAKFQSIADGITASIKQGQEQFGTTMGELSTNLNTMTGAGSARYLGTINTTQAQQYLAFIHIGQFPLYGVTARIVELDREGKVTPGNLVGVTIPVGDMIKGHANIQPFPNGLVISPDYFNANVFFTARNGDWQELLRERRVNGELLTALRVVGRFTSLKKEQTICERIDPKFPKKPNGDIDDDFRVGPKVPRCP
jgi:hypothetical protein